MDLIKLFYLVDIGWIHDEKKINYCYRILIRNSNGE